MIRMVVCQVHVISVILGFDFGNTHPYGHVFSQVLNLRWYQRSHLVRTSYALATSQFISPEFYKCAHCEIGEQRESKKAFAFASRTQCTVAEEINCNVAHQSAVAKEVVPTVVARQSVSRHHSSHLYQFKCSVQLAMVKSFPTASPSLLLPADVLCVLLCNLSSEFYGSLKRKSAAPAQLSLLGYRCQVQCYAQI